MEFESFPKIPRARRTVICTEKIDGTNACIVIAATSTLAAEEPHLLARGKYSNREEEYAIFAQSRSRFITPTSDNYGFAKWVVANAPELIDRLGPGRHYGEWWGLGIQRGYGLQEKRFSLFNAGRWSNPEAKPPCCHVVPIVAIRDDFSCVDVALGRLSTEGSLAAPGFMHPEGVVAFHSASQYMFKATLEKDEEWKGKEGHMKDEEINAQT